MDRIQTADNNLTVYPVVKTLKMRDDLALYFAYARARGWDLKGIPSENTIPASMKGNIRA